MVNDTEFLYKHGVCIVCCSVYKYKDTTKYSISCLFLDLKSLNTTET